jgi:predicted dehydrogenase
MMGASTSRAGANDRIRAAVIGVGGRGRDQLAALSKQENVDVVTLCDPDATRMAAAADQFQSGTGKKLQLEQDVRRVLEDRSIDVITIATPNHWHALAAIWACQAGKHVYVEKPVAHDVFEGRQMVEASRKYNRVVQGGTQRRSGGKLRKAIRALHTGVIGEIYMARCIHFQLRESLGFQSPELPPPTLNWDLWLGPGPQLPFHRNLVHYNWHWFCDFGNGELSNNGVHYVDIARWGMNKTLPVKIHSTGGRVGYKDQGQTPNVQLTTYEFADGTELVCEIRGRYANQEAGHNSAIFFYGSNGYMVVGLRGIEVFLGKSKQPEPELRTLDDVPQYENEDLSHFHNFFDAVRTGKRERLSAEINETYLSTVLCLLGNIAYRLKRELIFDPGKNQFTSDSQANAMLKGTYRRPFVVPDVV